MVHNGKNSAKASYTFRNREKMIDFYKRAHATIPTTRRKRNINPTIIPENKDPMSSIKNFMPQIYKK
jgi:hypothetical protein